MAQAILVTPLALRLFGVLLALLVASAATLIILCALAATLAAALLELVDTALATSAAALLELVGTAGGAKVLVLVLAAAALVVVALALLELVGRALVTEVLVLVLGAAALVEIIAVALLELVDAALIAEILILVLLFRRNRWTGLRAFGFSGVLMGLFVLFSQLTHGRPLPPYYNPARLSGAASFGTALYGHLLSPSRGILVFSPFLAALGLGIVLNRRRLLPDPIPGDRFVHL